jgi:hypothetical protein
MYQNVIIEIADIHIVKGRMIISIILNLSFAAEISLPNLLLKEFFLHTRITDIKISIIKNSIKIYFSKLLEIVASQNEYTKI